MNCWPCVAVQVGGGGFFALLAWEYHRQGDRLASLGAKAVALVFVVLGGLAALV